MWIAEICIYYTNAMHAYPCEYSIMHIQMHRRRSDTCLHLCAASLGAPSVPCRRSTARVRACVPSEPASVCLRAGDRSGRYLHTRHHRRRSRERSQHVSVSSTGLPKFPVTIVTEVSLRHAFAEALKDSRKSTQPWLHPPDYPRSWRYSLRHSG
jgi:hypothetical protein